MRAVNRSACQAIGISGVQEPEVPQHHSRKDDRKMRMIIEMGNNGQGGDLMKMVIEMDMDDWLQYGYQMGWCSPPVCWTHDGMPTSIIEDTDLEEGDPCVHLVRLYEDGEHKKAIEANHSPSVWRAANLGWT